MQTLELIESNVIVMDEFLPITKQSGIEKATTYAAMFAPFMINVKELSKKVIGIDKDNPTDVDAKIARDVRLSLVKNRTATGNKKDESKAALLAESNLIQSLHNVVVSTSQMIESDLLSIEKHAEIKEAARIEALKKERIELLSAYVEDASIFPLGTLTNQAFDDLLNGSKLSFEAKIEAAKAAEEKRIADEKADQEKQALIKAENERLKKEMEQKENELAKERADAKLKADQLAAENKKKLDAIEAANKLAREKAAAEQKKKDEAVALELKKQKDAADQLAAELKKKQDAEKDLQQKANKEAAEKLAAEKKAAKAPDKDKLKSAISLLPVFEISDLKTKEAKEVYEMINEKFKGFKTWALAQIETL